MSLHTHTTTQHPHIKELAVKLQKEVDLILTNVDEKKLYAEFRDEEMIDLKSGGEENIVRSTLDERIQQRITLRPKASDFSITAKSSAHVVKNVKKASSLVTLLFKKFEY